MPSRKPLILAALLILSFVGIMIYSRFFSDHRARAKSEWAEYDATVGSLESKLRELAQKVESRQGKGSCQADSHCHIVGLGTPSCGLYKDFLVYSTEDTDEPALLDAVNEFNQIHQKKSDMGLNLSNCGQPPAEVHCVQMRCRA